MGDSRQNPEHQRHFSLLEAANYLFQCTLSVQLQF